MTATAWTVAAVVLAGCGAYAASVLGGHGIACLPRSAVIRARWAWACRKPPARTEGEKLNRADHLTFTGLVETWRQSDGSERSRT
jgi:hypothetical protein